MSKAILVLDMSEDCTMCNFWNAETGECYASGATNTLIVHFEEDKPDECPLVELPEKMPEPVGYESIETSVKRVGWNALWDKIMEQ